MNKVTLTGMIQINDVFTPAKTQDANDVLFFIGDSANTKEYFHLEKMKDHWKLSTPKGEYILTGSSKKYTTIVNGHIITWCPKKIVGHLSW